MPADATPISGDDRSAAVASPETPLMADTAALQDELLRAQLGDLTFRRWFDLIKALLTALGALGAFMLVSCPDSSLGRKVFNEATSRERAKLLLEVLREPNPLTRSVSLEVIRRSYPNDKKWVSDVMQLVSLGDRYIVLQSRSKELEQLIERINRETNDAGGAITPAIDRLLQQAIRTSSEMQSIAAEFKQQHQPLPNEADTPVGAVTVGVRNVRSTQAELVGAALGIRTREWFDFDDNPSMHFSVEAKDGVGRALRLAPNTTYYFRYVVQRADITCFGEMRIFKTPPQ
ncbi:MAG: hypothetical protein QOF63_245 [Thermoanaerobaculia bacterium]|jgi:hypothetical protein|nr:hypothetical protein [Thermoanaerobaculia bacterium]